MRIGSSWENLRIETDTTRAGCILRPEIGRRIALEYGKEEVEDREGDRENGGDPYDDFVRARDA